MGVYTPIVANPNDGENITLCKILDTLSQGGGGGGGGGNSDVAVGPDGTTRVPLNVNSDGELKVNVEASVNADLTDIESKQDVTNSLLTTIQADLSDISTSSNQTNGNQKIQITNASGDIASIRQLGSQVLNTDKGIVVNALIHGLTTGGGGGYVDVKVNPSGSLVADVSGSSVSVSGTVSVSGPLTNTQLRASAVPVSAESLPLPSGAATEEGNLTTIATNTSRVPGFALPSYDYISLTYTSGNVTGVVYKTGGASGTTVATLTLAYSGSDIVSVTKS